MCSYAGISPYANLGHYDLSQTLQMRFNGWLRHKVRNVSIATVCYRSYIIFAFHKNMWSFLCVVFFKVSDQINSKHFCVFTPSEHAIQLDVIGEGHELQVQTSWAWLRLSRIEKRDKLQVNTDPVRDKLLICLFTSQSESISEALISFISLCSDLIDGLYSRGG